MTSGPATRASAHLKSFPDPRLKIDQSFIKGLSSGEDDDRAIAAAVISLGQKLNLRVIAEGVETEQQLAFLRQNGCDEVQGFHFSKPIKPDDLANCSRPSRTDRGIPRSVSPGDSERGYLPSSRRRRARNFRAGSWRVSDSARS